MDIDYTTPAGIHGIRAFQDNYIWAIRQGRKLALVDPGEAAPVLDVIRRQQLELTTILLTHHHRDHVGGVMALRELGPVKVYGPASENLPHCDVRLQEGDRVELPDLGLSLGVLDVPGHTAGHIAYHGRAADQAPVLFCGDTLFASGCGRLFEGTAAQMHRSLAKLMALPGQSRVYCAHEYTLANLRWACAVEPNNAALSAWHDQAAVLRERGDSTVPTRLDHELAVNPFLRSAEPDVVAAASQHVGRPVAPGVETFGALRTWKDDFR